MQKLSPWTPAIFALCFSLIQLFDSITSNDRSGLFFYGSIPFLFVFIGMFLSTLQNEIRDLRKQVNEFTSEPYAKKNVI